MEQNNKLDAHDNSQIKKSTNDNIVNSHDKSQAPKFADDDIPSSHDKSETPKSTNSNIVNSHDKSEAPKFANDDIPSSHDRSKAKKSTAHKSSHLTLLSWWYSLVTPPDPPATASFAQREKVRHARLVSLTVPLFMLFLLNMMPQIISSKSPVQAIPLLVGEIVCAIALFLNRKGLLNLAGILLLILAYIGSTFVVLTDPSGLTLSNLYHLDFTIVPDILALAFFSADILFLVVCINALQAWALVAYTPHDQIIAHILRIDPAQIFSHIYSLQLITAAVLYLWARSTEHAIKRADRAEEIAAFERHEKERREKELEQKRQLDAGIQQILQTHIAVANGDFSARAPLSQDHMLWQLAKALNNLIARIQRLSRDEQKFKQQAWKESEPITNEHISYDSGKITRTRINSMPHRSHQ